jgi:hypothetical protein
VRPPPPGPPPPELPDESVDEPPEPELAEPTPDPELVDVPPDPELTAKLPELVAETPDPLEDPVVEPWNLPGFLRCVDSRAMCRFSRASRRLYAKELDAAIFSFKSPSAFRSSFGRSLLDRGTRDSSSSRPEPREVPMGKSANLVTILLR